MIWHNCDSIVCWLCKFSHTCCHSKKNAIKLSFNHSDHMFQSLKTIMHYSESSLNRHYPLTVINSRVILGLIIPDQKFVATPRNISRNLLQNLIRTAWESGIFHRYLVAFLLHWFKGVNSETYLLKCLESAYITLDCNNHSFFINSFNEAE